MDFFLKNNEQTLKLLMSAQKIEVAFEMIMTFYYSKKDSNFNRIMEVLGLFELIKAFLRLK